MENKNAYYVGLDMGTNSVGWAVTDPEYHLLRAKGKDMWGIREFDEAKTSAERRAARISRRNRAKSVARIGLMTSYFAEELQKVDPYFLMRLQNSKYHLEDKDESVRNENGLFNDPDYTDADYFKDYPTIFHLRKALIQNEKTYDVRLVYLAVLNMFKHRGNFLNTSLSDEGEGKNMLGAYAAFQENIQNEYELVFPEVDITQMENILSNRELSRSKRAEELAGLFGLERGRKREIAFLKGFCGLNMDLKVLFDLETDEKIAIAFSDFGYDEKILEIAEKIPEEAMRVIESMKEIYDIGTLSAILKGSEYLSYARVESYEKHHEDLKILKRVYREYLSEDDYDRMFRSEEKGTYSAYVNSVNTEKKKQRRSYTDRKAEHLYKSIKNDLKKIKKSSEDIEYILSEIDKETFLPKQLTSENGVIPNQVHSREMKVILENASAYLPFLNEIDESGLTIKERMVRLFSFSIPYYVGPVPEENSAVPSSIKEQKKHSWAIRKEKGKILPWNIEEKIDLKKTSEMFISRMVRECTYMAGESVLPKNSLLYERYCVLNEINNLRIDDEPISVSLKQDIYNDLFLSGKKVTRSKLVKYLIARGVLISDEQLFGIDKNINSTLASYGKYKAVFGDLIDTDNGKKMVEDIIFWSTVYGDSKEFLKQQIQEHYPEITKEQIKRVSGMKPGEWGNLSRSFLELQAAEKGTGEVYSLIRALWETNMNLMELIHSEEYTFSEAIINQKSSLNKLLSEFTYEDLEDYYFSAPVKRMVWQTLGVLKDIVSVKGYAPERVFIEMTRGDDEKGDTGRKESRESYFLEKYKSESKEWKQIISDAAVSGTLRSKKMYLYLSQMGRDMYTGEIIDLDALMKDNTLYDIDHIYPRHFVKDDNIANNLVLVSKTKNANKSDVYPLDSAIRNNERVRNLWSMLRSRGLINEEKYRRLTGSNPFSEEQQADFIARQMVETSQGTKGIADLLKQLLPDTQIVYSKAKNVSEFRQHYDFPKSRLINEFHHANDAYLNIVVGNVYYVKFGKDPRNFIKNEYQRDTKKNHYNLSRMFDFDVIRNTEQAWKAQNEKEPGTIVIVRKMMGKNTPILTRMSFEQKGAIANATLYSHTKAKPEVYIPLKAGDSKMQEVEKYGGFTSASTAYFFLVEHEVKNKRIRTLETVPIYMKNKIESTEDGLLEYCKEQLGLVGPNIRVKKIKLQSLVKLNGYFVHISGKTGNQILLRNAVQLALSDKWQKYVHTIEKAAENSRISPDMTKESNIQLYAVLSEKFNSHIFSKKPNPVGMKLESGKDKFMSLEAPEQVGVLYQILNLTKVGLTSADLSAIGGASKAGVSLMSKKVTDNKEFVLYYQSPTGMFQSCIDLLTV